MTDRQKVANGLIVRVQGYEMIVSEMKIQKIKKTEVVRFIGTCTPNPVNDPIRGTGYDGGIYGGNRTIYDF